MKTTTSAGTAIEGKTDAKGGWMLPGIGKGVWTVEFKKDGYVVLKAKVTVEQERTGGGFLLTRQLQKLVQNDGHLLGIEAHQSDIGLFPKNRDQQTLMVKGAHQDVLTMSFVIESAEFRFTQPLGEFMGRGKRARREGGQDAEIKRTRFTALGEEVAPLVDQG